MPNKRKISRRTHKKNQQKAQPPPIAPDTIKWTRRWGNQFSQKYTTEQVERLGEEMVEWFKVKKNIWLRDFAAEKMIGRQRLSEFADANEYFAYLFEIAKTMQESKLFKLGKTWKSAMPIFALKNVANWKDKQEIDHTNAGGSFGSLDNDALRTLVTHYAKLAEAKRTPADKA